MKAEEFLRDKGINPIEPIYWDTTDVHGDRYIEINDLMEEYAQHVLGERMPELLVKFAMGLKYKDQKIFTDGGIGKIVSQFLEDEQQIKQLCRFCKIGDINNDFGCTNLDCEMYPFK